MWRAEDEALLRRLEDERILERLWFMATGQREPPHRRAAGLVSLIGRTDSGRAPHEQARQGDTAPLARFIDEAPLSGLEPELLHHLAVYLGRVADTTCDASPDHAAGARVRSLSAWIALQEQRSYLRDLARDVAGPSVPSAELERAVDDVARGVIDAVGRQAEEGARARTNRAQAAWRALSRVRQACRAAGISGQAAESLVARAENRRNLAVESALAPIAEAISDASARGALADDAVRALHPATTLWSWAEHEEAVERFVVDQVSDAAWELYRDGRWDDLRALIGPLSPLVDSLCERITVHRDPIGYLAACAHMLVFRAETASTLSEQIALAERALSLCPAHRNTHIVLCSYLCRWAIHEMERTVFFVGEERIAEIAEAIVRAEGLNPSSRSLEEAKLRLIEFKRRSHRRSM